MRTRFSVLLLCLLFVVDGLEVSLEGCKTPLPAIPSLKQMHTQIRDKFTSTFKETTDPRGVVYIEGASVSKRHDTADTELPFRQESNFIYLTGVDLPDFSMAIDIENQVSYLFAPKRDQYYAIWNGEVMSLEEIQELYGSDVVLYDELLITTLEEITQNNMKKIYLLPDRTLPPFQNVDNSNTLETSLGRSRVTKIADEILLMRIAAQVSSDAHIALMKDSKVGLYEYNYGGYFVYYTTSCGLLHQSYEPIVGSGNRSAILHYTSKKYQTTSSDIILIDAGAEFKGYGTDITRTYPVNGIFSPEQTLIYSLVLEVVEAIESQVLPGASWRSLTVLSQHLVCQKLLEAGFLRGNLEELIQKRMWVYFYPHGLGHSVGIDVHDPGLSDILEENMVVTVEPGIYFNKVFIQEALKDPLISPFLVIEKINFFLDMNFGGVRIEDIVLVTSSGMENLAVVPKTIPEIEAIMKPNL